MLAFFTSTLCSDFPFRPSYSRLPISFFFSWIYPKLFLTSFCFSRAFSPWRVFLASAPVLPWSPPGFLTISSQWAPLCLSLSTTTFYSAISFILFRIDGILQWGFLVCPNSENEIISSLSSAGSVLKSSFLLLAFELLPFTLASDW